MSNLQYVWQKSPLQEAIKDLPRAIRHPISVIRKFDHANKFDSEGVLELEQVPKSNRFHAVSVKNEVVGVVSPRYRLVQHSDAFGPIAKGLEMANTTYDWNLFAHGGRAWLSVICDEASDGVRIGFQAMNSVDGSTAIRYSFAMSRTTKVIELVGYRLACDNGMKMRVPLQNAEFVALETRVKIENLLQQHHKIIHTGDHEQEIQAVQYVVEAVSLLKDSVSKIIEKAMDTGLARDQMEQMVETYIGKRMKQRVVDRFAYENPSLWGLYNAITYVASHDNIAQSTSTALINKAATLLEHEV